MSQLVERGSVRTVGHGLGPEVGAHRSYCAGTLPVHVLYVTDPACPWSWGAEPAVRRLEAEFGDEVRITYVMGGLWREIRPAEALAQTLDAAAQSGMPADPRLWLDAPLLVSKAARTRQTQFLITDADFSRKSEQAASAPAVQFLTARGFQQTRVEPTDATIEDSFMAALV